ncbi:MAG TPA: response regulator [Candidatus Omnitrophota bacterium]|nr:response regulator [Candidatus Omnitrophota bacterium]
MAPKKKCPACGKWAEIEELFCPRCRSIVQQESKPEDFGPEFVEIEETPAPKAPAEPPKKKESGRAKKRILIIDDEEALTMALSDLLQERGYDIAIAHNGAQGLDEVEKEAPDLIILDVLMPKMTGYEFLKHLETQTGARDIPVIIMTARGDMQGFFEPWDFKIFMTKPIDLDNLLNVVDEILKPKTA